MVAVYIPSGPKSRRATRCSCGPDARAYKVICAVPSDPNGIKETRVGVASLQPAMPTHTQRVQRVPSWPIHYGT